MDLHNQNQSFINSEAHAAKLLQICGGKRMRITSQWSTNYVRVIISVCQTHDIYTKHLKTKNSSTELCKWQSSWTTVSSRPHELDGQFWQGGNRLKSFCYSIKKKKKKTRNCTHTHSVHNYNIIWYNQRNVATVLKKNAKISVLDCKCKAFLCITVFKSKSNLFIQHI